MAEDDEFIGEERILPHMTASEGLVEFLCAGNARCIPLSSCQPLLQLVEKSCLSIIKLRDLTCGYKADEPLVCCPQCTRDVESHIGGSFPPRPPPSRPSNSKQCGHPQLYNWQGTNYKGIGSQPWVVRVGFKNIRKRQQQIDLPVIGLDRCVRVYGGSVPLSMNEICVGGEEGKDACSGFGGAPLVLMDKVSKGHFTQIGIVSFGSEKCGVEGIPSVYVRVDQYLDWIKLNSPNEG
ncbi:hypothetical protein LSTR_LSTR005478 [Laodelphax striatellus]|uniref:Uncharacterized protein n=1 Tax=Laodelphax striatellus TaxID=195883 RepID=A0A482WWZ4_LAOST|nr:hypothetical protein LSTR_LSTR005478 [Laodelphax striatellus]